MNEPEPRPVTPSRLFAPPCERYAALWGRETKPDLGHFLGQIGPLDSVELAAVIRVDQLERWERGEPTLVEKYLERHPGVRDDSEAALDLIYNEYLIREKRGEQPTAEEYRARFPQLARAIATQLELHEALFTEDAEGNLPDDAGHVASILATARDHAGVVELPESFGRYRILEKLGQGGMGAVYVAIDTKLDRRVALKALRLGPDPGGRLVQRFLREARIAASFTDPHLCPVYDAGEHDGQPFLTMPLLEGETLATRLSRTGSIPRNEAVRLTHLIARALGKAHAAGVVHRDVKPANVMIDSKGEPIILDFGLARRPATPDGPATALGMVIGTPAYMAPEQVGNDPDSVGPCSDIYSLGVMLYQMLTGRFPFHGSSHEILQQKLTRVPEPPSKFAPGISPALDRICLTALAREPSNRYPSMESFAEAVKAEMDDRQLTIDRSSPPGRGGRRRLLLGLCVLCVLSLGLILAGFFASRSRHTGLEPEEGDSFAAGAHWTGMFVFRPPFVGYKGDVDLRILERRPGWLRGVYTTEQGMYEWEVEGTTDGRKLRFEFTKAVKDNEEHTVVGRARVEGEVKGPQLTAVFNNPGLGIADLTLTREDK